MAVSSTVLSGYMRVGSLAIASYDYLQTMPFEWRTSREHWRGRRLTLPFILFFLLRYTSILVLTVSNIGFFYTHFTHASCAKYYMIPSVFKVLQAMVSQAILVFRAYSLSRKSAQIGYVLLVIYIISCTFSWVSTLYARRKVSVLCNQVSVCVLIFVRSCASSSPHTALGGWVHYAVAIVYDFITSAFCVVSLLQIKASSTSIMTRVTKMMLADGVWYFMALALVNALNLAFYRAAPIADEVQTAAASLGYCVTWIMSQKLLIHLHDASVERRNESINAAVTITQKLSSAREVSRAIRSQFESKNGMGLDLTVPDFDLEAELSEGKLQEEVDVQVRIERTVRMEPVPVVYELENYSRHTTRSRPQ
ncbi:hypothetical protein GGX14DRAFT_499016 [Mycena pura]|uniref:DUF6533 domain-containing protein n=1 Tax=Mycena pura TaxID=153505 RepID=A0AAD6YH44_9AGAR|nr:hypothetical protein GGX14DRAFT_499016 [Mycena pura]